MSYEIIYDRRFIHSPLGITPMVLAGSNNCYEPMPGGRERRERNWSPLFNFAAITEEELMKQAEACCGGMFQQHFKWRGKFVDDAGLMAFVRNGIKGALTLEAYQEYANSGALSCALSIWYRDGVGTNRRELSRTVSTSDELTNWINEARTRMANRGDNEEIYYDMRFFGKEPLRLSGRNAISGAVVAVRGKYYVSNCMPGKLETTLDVTKAMIFSDMAEARLKIDPYFLRNMRFLKADNVKARISWKYCIQIDGGARGGMYVERLTRSRLHMACHADSAKKFPNRKEAERYIDKRLNGRFSIPGFRVCEVK